MSQASTLLADLISGNVSDYANRTDNEALVLVDPTTNKQYKLHVVDGELMMTEVMDTSAYIRVAKMAGDSPFIVDPTTGIYYKLHVVDGQLTMSETDPPPGAEPHIIVDNDRYITVPSELHRIAVQYDHDIETVTFDCPRYWDGNDLSIMKVYINYTRPDGEVGGYLCDLVTVDSVDPTVIHFDWTIDGHVTEAHGTLSFSVCAKEVDEAGNETRHWNSELNSEMHISAGLEATKNVVKKYPDIITQLLTKMERLEQCEVAVTGEQILNLQTQIGGMNSALTAFEVSTNQKITNLETADTDLTNRVKALEDKKISTINGDLTVTGTLTANKIVGAVYA